MFPPPNAPDLMPGGLLVKKSMEKCPKFLKTIKYEPSYALGGAASELHRPAPPPWTSLRHQGREGRGGGRPGADYALTPAPSLSPLVAEAGPGRRRRLLELARRTSESVSRLRLYRL